MYEQEVKLKSRNPLVLYVAHLLAREVVQLGIGAVIDLE
jgi:hypothetical protein